MVREHNVTDFEEEEGQQQTNRKQVPFLEKPEKPSKQKLPMSLQKGLQPR